LQFLHFRTSKDKTLTIFSDFKISEKELFLIKFDIVRKQPNLGPGISKNV